MLQCFILSQWLMYSSVLGKANCSHDSVTLNKISKNLNDFRWIKKDSMINVRRKRKKRKNSQ